MADDWGDFAQEMLGGLLPIAAGAIMQHNEWGPYDPNVQAQRAAAAGYTERGQMPNDQYGYEGYSVDPAVYRVRAGANGSGGAAAAGTFFKPTMAGARAKSLLVAESPTTGTLKYWRYVGVPHSFSGDKRIARHWNKDHPRPRSRKRRR